MPVTILTLTVALSVSRASSLSSLSNPFIVMVSYKSFNLAALKVYSVSILVTKPSYAIHCLGADV